MSQTEHEQWVTQPECYSTMLSIYTMESSSALLQSGTWCKETTEYNKAAGQFAKLSNIPIGQITKIQRLVYSADSLRRLTDKEEI